MTATHSSAKDEMARIFTEAWDDRSGPQIGRVDPVLLRYAGVLFYSGQVIRPIDAKEYWARFSVRPVMSRQSAFVMTEDPGPSPYEYDTNGLVFIQIFAPMAEVDGSEKGDLLAELAQAIFRRAETPGGIVFRNTRINPLEDDKTHFRWNVITEYEYGELV